MPSRPDPDWEHELLELDSLHEGDDLDDDQIPLADTTRGQEANGRRKVYLLQTTHWVWDDGPYTLTGYDGQAVLAFTTLERARAYVRLKWQGGGGTLLGIVAVFLDEDTENSPHA